MPNELSLRPIDSKEQLNEFLRRAEVRPYAQFFQTWEWGEFHQSLDHQIHRLGFFDDGALVATILLVEDPDTFGPILYGPRGPVTDYSNHAQTEAVIRLLTREARRLAPKSICLRLDPAIPACSGEAKPFASVGYRPAGRFIQVERSWMVDLQPTHEGQIEWQKAHGMRSNLPRYLRRAEREGVVVRSSDRPEDMETFLDLLYQLDQRKEGIGLFPRSYYRLQLAALGPSGYERVFIAEKAGEPLAAALIAMYGDEASYLWGASSDRHRELRAPHFMHFGIMREAFRHGCRRYNFWGIVRDEHHHPGYRGYGYSEFKRSFGGYVVLYQRAQDYAYRPLRYRLTWLNDKRRLRTRQLE